jgi:hypothetical protein
LNRSPTSTSASTGTLTSTALLGLALAAVLTSCRTTLPEYHLVGGQGTWDEDIGEYRVLLVLENGSPEPLDFADIYFELTTYDDEGDILLDHDPRDILADDLPALDQTTILLSQRDPAGRTERSVVTLKDRTGRVIHELEVANSAHGI